LSPLVKAIKGGPSSNCRLFQQHLPKADKQQIVSLSPLSADIVAKVPEQMLWNWN
jgi:hypothetical protein